MTGSRDLSVRPAARQSRPDEAKAQAGCRHVQGKINGVQGREPQNLWDTNPTERSLETISSFEACTPSLASRRQSSRCALGSADAGYCVRMQSPSCAEHFSSTLALRRRMIPGEGLLLFPEFPTSPSTAACPFLPPFNRGKLQIYRLVRGGS